MEEAGPTRRSHRERTVTTKAAEQERLKHGEKAVDGNHATTPSQRPSKGRIGEEGFDKIKIGGK